MQVWMGKLNELQLPVQNPAREGPCTDGQMDRWRNWTSHRAAWLQIKRTFNQMYRLGHFHKNTFRYSAVIFGILYQTKTSVFIRFQTQLPKTIETKKNCITANSYMFCCQFYKTISYVLLVNIKLIHLLYDPSLYIKLRHKCVHCIFTSLYA